MFAGMGSVVAAWCYVFPLIVAAEQAVEQPTRLQALIRQLDDESFDVRRRAVADLARLVKETHDGAALAERFESILADESASGEIRAALEPLLSDLPAAPELKISSEGIAFLLIRLDGDSYSVRAAAAAQIERLGRHPATLGPLLEEIKVCLGDPKLADTSRSQLEQLWRRLHGRWLLADPETWKLAPVDDATIGRWIDEMAGEGPGDAAERRIRHQAAERELLDLVARPDTSLRLAVELEKRLAGPRLDSTAQARLKGILDWTRPMVAFESWHLGRRATTQFFSVPKQSREADAAGDESDRVSDCTLHCATDAILPKGDYPIGEAVCEGDPSLFWYGVNLPTARRRLAYDYVLRNYSDAQRLAEITAKTLQRHIDFRRQFTDITLLDQLDGPTVSRLAGAYFAAVDDSISAFAAPKPGIGSPSRHGDFCFWLAENGTPAGISGLVSAAETGRFYKPDNDCKLNVGWIAALTIADRDPSAAEDQWLAGQIDRDEKLELDAAAEVGATAAAMLLHRHSERPIDFNLEEVSTESLSRCQFKAYRFPDAACRAGFLRWWKEQAKTR